MNHRERMRQRPGLGVANSNAAMREFADGSGQNIEFNIDELIVEGVGAEKRDRVAQALNSELTRILHDQGLPPALVKERHREALDGGKIALARNSRAEAIGSQVAQAVYRAIARGESNDVRSESAMAAHPGASAKS